MIESSLAAIRAAALLAAALSLANCRTERPWDLVPVPALDLPEAFRLGGLPPPAQAAGGCAGQLTDPRDQTVIRLQRSTATGGPAGGALGDYEVLPHGRYGGDEGTLLRVDCGTRQGLGLVPGRR